MAMETLLKKAERHVVEGEARVARQREILTRMVEHNHLNAALSARALLATMEHSLQLGREHLDRLRREPPDPA
jgi:hypothetical protein